MKHILMVDDEADIDILTLQKFRHEISEQKYQFHFARDGMQALKIIKENKSIAVVITDINMPRMNGFELLNKIQLLQHKPSTIIVSAYGDSDSINRIKKSGASGFVNKPIDYVELKHLITTLLDISDSDHPQSFRIC